MSKVFKVLGSVLLGSILLAASCEVSPTPTPSPTPIPTPTPTPTPIPPEPTPEPVTCPDKIVEAIKTGQREMKATPHNNGFDSTPRVCGNAEVSILVGRPGQYCVPLGPEGDEETNFRSACEEVFNFGPTPLWIAEGDIRVGQRPWEYSDGYSWQVFPRGVGRIKACDRNLVTCSVWRDVNRP
jgi:hypothetical protein